MRLKSRIRHVLFIKYRNTFRQKLFLFLLLIAAGIVIFQNFKCPSSNLDISINITHTKIEENNKSAVELALALSVLFEAENISYIVNTTGCKIFDMGPYDNGVRKFIGKSKGDKEKCLRKPALVNIVNHTFLELSPERKHMNCCYKEIKRINQDPKIYNSSADDKYDISKECIPIYNGMKLEKSFLKITCIGEYHYTFQDYQSILLPPEKHCESTKEKVKYWNVIPNRPPNILVIGIDSLSRLHFIRSMPKLREFLTNNDFIEMKGFTRIGESTLPNHLGSFAGISEADARKLCWANDSVKFDDCPFIWQEFSKRNYLTGFIEDSPGIGTFNYHRTGFVEPPTDYYTRPLMLAHHESLHTGNGGTNAECISGGTPTDFLIKYAKDFLEVVKDYPFFLFSWFTSIGHDDINGPPTVDNDFQELLNDSITAVGNNSVILFLSDHGYRYGNFRQSTNGFFEGSLPTFYIRIPPSLKKFRPDWYQNLKSNGERLTSPLDIYKTFEDLLHLSDHDRIYWKTKENVTDHNPFGGTSLFNPISESRNCSNARIPEEFCMCELIPKFIDIKKENKNILEQFSNAAIKQINSIIGPHLNICSPLHLKKVLFGMQLTKSDSHIDYMVRFSTTFGARFEAKARIFKGKSVFQILGSISRINSYAGQSDCVESSELKIYCICKDVIEPFYALIVKMFNSEDDDEDPLDS